MSHIKVMPLDQEMIVVAPSPSIPEVFDWLKEHVGKEGKDWSIVQIRGKSLRYPPTINEMSLDNTPEWISFQFVDKSQAVRFKLTFG